MAHTTHQIDLETLNVNPPAVLDRYRGKLMAVAGLGVIGTAIGFAINPAQAFHSYLIGFMMCIGLTLGPLGFIFIWHLTGGRWGLPMRRIWEAATRNIYFCALLFIPIAIWYKLIFPWAHPEQYATNWHVQQLIKNYLNIGMFVGRAIAYFGTWIILIYLQNKWSAIQDAPNSRPLGYRFSALSGPGIVIYFFGMSFAAIDWTMSLRPAWPSTIYAMIIVVGNGILGLALGIIMANILVRHEPMNKFMDEVVFHDNGKLLLAFTMLWAYTSFSQWLIIWSGNLPEEIVFYLDRLRGGWQYASLMLAVLGFCVPFAMLLSASLKKNPSQLVWVAGWLVVMRWWDLYWDIEPAYHAAHFFFNWMDAVIPIAMIAVWGVLYLRNLSAHPLLPLYDPHTLRQAEVEHE